jgi:hypothetical protein
VTALCRQLLHVWRYRRLLWQVLLDPNSEETTRLLAAFDAEEIQL